MLEVYVFVDYSLQYILFTEYHMFMHNIHVQCDSQRDWKVRFFTFWSISRPYCMQFTPNKNQHVLLSLQINVVPISRQQVTFMEDCWQFKRGHYKKQLG